MTDISVQEMLTWTPEEIEQRVRQINRPDGTCARTASEIRECLEQMIVDGVWSVTLKHMPR